MSSAAVVIGALRVNKDKYLELHVSSGCGHMHSVDHFTAEYITDCLCYFTCDSHMFYS